jgi:hypothetical protein
MPVSTLRSHARDPTRLHASAGKPARSRGLVWMAHLLHVAQGTVPAHPGPALWLPVLPLAPLCWPLAVKHPPGSMPIISSAKPVSFWEISPELWGGSPTTEPSVACDTQRQANAKLGPGSSKAGWECASHPKLTSAFGIQMCGVGAA